MNKKEKRELRKKEINDIIDNMINNNNEREKNIKKNGFKNIVENIANQNLFKAPITNTISADYNLRQDLYTLNFYNLTYRYCTDGIFKTLIQQPVIDAFKDFRIISNLLDEDDKKKILNIFYKKKLKQIILDLFFMDRLYGGSGLILDYNDNDKDYDYIVVNRWELSNTSSNSVKSDYYKCNVNDNIYYMGEMIEPDNILLLKGQKAPYFIEKMLNGWGLSIVEPLIAPSNLYQKTLNLIYELLDESKIDVYGVDGLKDSVLAGQEKAVIDKIQLTNILKNFQNAIVLDKADTFEQKQIGNINSIVEILKEIKLDICSSMKIPAIILWGMSPSGFSSGEYDLLQYQDKIKQEIQPELKRIIIKVLQIEIENNFNTTIDDLDIEFEGFILQTREMQENINEKLFNRINILYDKKLITKKEMFDYLKSNRILNQNFKAEGEDEYGEGEEENFSMNNNENTETKDINIDME